MCDIQYTRRNLNSKEWINKKDPCYVRCCLVGSSNHSPPLRTCLTSLLGFLLSVQLEQPTYLCGRERLGEAKEDDSKKRGTLPIHIIPARLRSLRYCSVLIHERQCNVHIYLAWTDLKDVLYLYANCFTRRQRKRFFSHLHNFMRKVWGKIKVQLIPREKSAKVRGLLICKLLSQSTTKPMWKFAKWTFFL